MKRSTAMKGISLVEVVIGAAIAALVLAGLVASFTAYLRARLLNTSVVQASYLLEEGMEAVTFMRDSGWGANIAGLTTLTNYYLVYSVAGGGKWATTTVNTFIDGRFDRHFVVESVYRDAGGNIVPAGTLDPDIRKVTVYVAFLTSAGTTTRTITSYIGNIFSN